MGHYVDVKDLPDVLQDALKSVGYHRDNVMVDVKEKICPRPPSSKGRRGFCTVVRLDESGEYKTAWGSFGGSNMFVQSIDDVHETVEIPADTAFVMGTGSGGKGYPAYAHITISPANINPKLLAPNADVTEKESKILAVFTLKSGYRKEALSRLGATEDEVDSLVSRGFLKQRAKNGATRLTTEGRNAASSTYWG